MPFQFRKEAIEEDLNSNFPSQGQGNPPLYYSLSEVVVPTYSINNVTEGSILGENLQTAWDFSTGHSTVQNTTSTLVSNAGFWTVDLNCSYHHQSTSRNGVVSITDGLTSKPIWEINTSQFGADDGESVFQDRFVVFLRSGDSLTATSSTNAIILDIVYRQIATVNGTLVNPLGFSAA